MPDSGELLAAKFEAIFPHLDERQRRLLMGAEARVLGHGGIRVVARAAGVREATVSLGAGELEAGTEPLRRARKPGGGRKRLADLDPGCGRPYWRWWSLMSAATRCRRCGGRPSRCGRFRASSPGRVTGPAPTRWLTCCGRRASACRATPRRSRATRSRTGTPSSA